MGTLRGWAPSGRMAYRLGYWTVDGQLVAEQFWVPQPGRLRHPLIGDVLMLDEAEWRVTDYVLFEKSGTGHVAIEPMRR